jgi:cytochrome c biogenesis protein CcmG, thiol:disulfide interchange protein DsbE
MSARVMSRHRTRWIALTVAVVLVGFGVVLAVQHRTEAAVPRLVQEHKAAPSFDLTTLDSKSISSRALAGKTYVVNFWNSWCIPCQQEHAALAQFYARHKNDGDFEMIGIVRDDTASAARASVRANHDGWVFATDPEGRASLQFGTTGQPESYMIAPNGVVVGVQRSPVTVANLEEMLAVARRSA